MDQSFLSARLDRAAAPLVVGDVVALLAVLTIGVINHSGSAFVLENPGHMVGVYAPFLISWALVAPLVGAYSAGAAETAKSSLPLVIRSWIPAAVIGFLLRGFVPVFPGGLHWTFVLVLFVTGLVGLAGWRLLYFKLR